MANPAADFPGAVHTATDVSARLLPAGLATVIGKSESELVAITSQLRDVCTDSMTVYVNPNGDNARDGLTERTAVQTISAALTLMGTDRGNIRLSTGTHYVGATLAWPATAECGLIGEGSNNTSIRAVSQTGPVLDMSASTGYPYGQGGGVFGGFMLYGDGTTGVNKKGLKLSSTESIAAYFYDITVWETGGAPFDLGIAELCVFDRLTCNGVPIDGVANDVPYFTSAADFNGNTLRDCLINPRGNETTANVGPSGAVVIDGGARNIFESWKLEGITLPTNGTVFAISGTSNQFDNIHDFDCAKATGATGTSVYHFNGGTAGGNTVKGILPIFADTAVLLDQSYNTVDASGILNSVTISPGVTNSFVRLFGRRYEDLYEWNVNDLSGNNTNIVEDLYRGFSPPFGSCARYLLADPPFFYGSSMYLDAQAVAADGVMSVVPFWVPHTFALTGIGCKVITAAASSAVRLGIYNTYVGSDLPGVLVLDAGTVSSTTTGDKIISISQTLNPGLYYLAACAQGGAPTLASLGSIAIPPVASYGGIGELVNCRKQSGVTAGLPTYEAGASGTNGYLVMVRAYVA